jgi:hypothetical protein
MPTIDGGWLDQHQRFPPPGPQPAQNQPEQAVRAAEASIGTRENAQLVAKLEEEVSTREQGGPKRRNRPQRVSHLPQHGRQQRQRQRFSTRTR